MFKSVAELEVAQMSSLVEFYNSRSAKPVKKFADRQTAVKRCALLLEVGDAIDSANQAGGAEQADLLVEEASAKPAVHKPRPVRAVKHSADSEEESAEDSAKLDDMSDEEFEANMRAELSAKPVEEKPSAKPTGRRSNSQGIAASWLNNDVANRRLTRDGVVVQIEGVTTEHKSVRAAFAYYRLPDSKHIRFRGKLKDDGIAIFLWEGKEYQFTIVKN